MTPTLFILSVTFYLFSIVSTIVLSFFYKIISYRIVITVIIFHVLVLISYFLFKSEMDTLMNPGASNYLFLCFFCSALLISGVVLRMKYPVYIKAYFSIYLLSVFFFVTSPSRLLGFIASGKPTAFNPVRIHIKDNYFFVEQGSGSLQSSNRLYKLVREMGVFHKTLARDISIPSETDSLQVLEFDEKQFLYVKIYYLKNHIPESIDLKIPLRIERDSSGIITRKITL